MQSCYSLSKNACLNTYHFKQKNRKTYTFSLWPPLSHNKSSLIHKIAPLLPSLPQLGPFCTAKNNWKQWLGPWQELFTRCGIFQRKKTHIYSHLHQPLKTFLSLSASVLKHCCFHLTRHRAGMEATPVWAGRDNVRKLLLCMSLKFGNLPSVSQLAPWTKNWDNNQPQVSWEVMWWNTAKLLDITALKKMVTTNNNT